MDRELEAVRDLTVFVHIGKTAGSTMNRILANWSSGSAHLEGVVADKKRLKEIVSKADWVSAHIPLPQFAVALRSVTQRPFRLMTLVRDPLTQVASHYNWLIEIHARGEKFYNQHPPQIKNISERIRAAANHEPRAVIEQLAANRGLFLNPQCRMAIGTDVTGWTQLQILRALRAYDVVGYEDNLTQVAEMATGQPLMSEVRENTSSYHFDPAVFRTPELIDFLRRENAGDFALYNAISGNHSAKPDEPEEHHRSRLRRWYSAIAKRSVIPAT